MSVTHNDEDFRNSFDNDFRPGDVVDTYDEKDAQLMRVNMAIADLAVVAADLHAYDEDGDSEDNLRAILAHMENVGHTLIEWSEIYLFGYAREGWNYVHAHICEELPPLGGNGYRDYSAINQRYRDSEVRQWLPDFLRRHREYDEQRDDHLTA